MYTVGFFQAHRVLLADIGTRAGNSELMPLGVECSFLPAQMGRYVYTEWLYTVHS